MQFSIGFKGFYIDPKNTVSLFDLIMFLTCKFAQSILPQYVAAKAGSNNAKISMDIFPSCQAPVKVVRAPKTLAPSINVKDI